MNIFLPKIHQKNLYTTSPTFRSDFKGLESYQSQQIYHKWQPRIHSKSTRKWKGCTTANSGIRGQEGSFTHLSLRCGGHQHLITHWSFDNSLIPEMWLWFYMCYFDVHFSNLYLQNFQWKYPAANAACSHLGLINIGSGNGLVPDGFSLVSEVMWHSPENGFTAGGQATIL